MVCNVGDAQRTERGPLAAGQVRNRCRGRHDSVPSRPTGSVKAVAALARTGVGHDMPAWVLLADVYMMVPPSACYCLILPTRLGLGLE